MHQVVEQTRDEKIAMYMKETKTELAEMLFNCNAALDRVLTKQGKIRDQNRRRKSQTGTEPNGTGTPGGVWGGQGKR